MSGQIRVRVVTSQEDSAIECDAAKSSEGYEVLGVDTVEIAPDGRPIAKDLDDSLPDEGLIEPRFVEPVAMIVTITLATLAIRLVNHWMKEGEAGVQIDQRTTPATISRLAGVPFGTLAIIDRNGATTIHREAYDEPEDVISKLGTWVTG